MTKNEAKQLVWRYIEHIARGDDFDQMFGDEISREACGDETLARMLDSVRLEIADQLKRKIKN